MDFLIHHMLRNSAARHPEKEALVHGVRRLTYREVADRCASLACGLRSAGMQRGDRLGIYLDPSVEQVLSIFSISQAGGVYVPINTVLVPEQVAHIARDCGMKALITTPDKLEMLLPDLHDVSSLQFFVLTSKSNAQDTTDAKVDSKPVHGLEEMLRLPVEDRWPDWGISVDLAAILYTSGSTGKPKGVMLSHATSWRAAPSCQLILKST